MATIGEYTAKDGSKKKRYIPVGTVFINEQDRMSIKIESIPVGPEWSGWLSCYEPKNATGQGKPAQKPQQDDDDSIPF